MNTNINQKHIAEEISYRIIRSETQVRPFGIAAAMANDPSDCAEAENLFFTKAEACACCEWLAENQVFPVTLCDVLANIYVL